jgi:hypothetical protein
MGGHLRFQSGAGKPRDPYNNSSRVILFLIKCTGVLGEGGRGMVRGNGGVSNRASQY